jgi:hypothetical protein
MIPTPAETRSSASTPNCQQTLSTVDIATPDGSTNESLGLPSAGPYNAPRRGNPAPRAQEISNDSSEDNIIVECMRHRRQAYMTALQEPEKLDTYPSAFAIGLRRVHREQLPPPPRSWKELLKHPQHEGFRAAAEKEYRDLERRQTFRLVPRTSKLGLLIFRALQSRFGRYRRVP